MVSLDDAVAMITALPAVNEGERYRNRTWFVGRTAFAWERPFTKADIGRFGDEPIPSGAILALTTEDLSEKAAILAAGDTGLFTISHFDDYPAILVQLDAVDPEVLHRNVVDAWLTGAPETLAREYLDQVS